MFSTDVFRRSMVSFSVEMSVVALASWFRNWELCSDMSSLLFELAVATIHLMACVVLSSNASRTAFAC